jgi:hypothetical protein
MGTAWALETPTTKHKRVTNPNHGTKPWEVFFSAFKERAVVQISKRGDPLTATKGGDGGRRKAAGRATLRRRRSTCSSRPHSIRARAHIRSLGRPSRYPQKPSRRSGQVGQVHERSNRRAREGARKRRSRRSGRVLRDQALVGNLARLPLDALFLLVERLCGVVGKLADPELRPRPLGVVGTAPANGLRACTSTNVTGRCATANRATSGRTLSVVKTHNEQFDAMITTVHRCYETPWIACIPQPALIDDQARAASARFVGGSTPYRVRHAAGTVGGSSTLP